MWNFIFGILRSARICPSFARIIQKHLRKINVFPYLLVFILLEILQL